MFMKFGTEHPTHASSAALVLELPAAHSAECADDAEIDGSPWTLVGASSGPGAPQLKTAKPSLVMRRDWNGAGHADGHFR